MRTGKGRLSSPASGIAISNVDIEFVTRPLCEIGWRDNFEVVAAGAGQRRPSIERTRPQHCETRRRVSRVACCVLGEVTSPKLTWASDVPNCMNSFGRDRAGAAAPDHPDSAGPDSERGFTPQEHVPATGERSLSTTPRAQACTTPPLNTTPAASLLSPTSTAAPTTPSSAKAFMRSPACSTEGQQTPSQTRVTAPAF